MQVKVLESAYKAAEKMGQRHSCSMVESSLPIMSGIFSNTCTTVVCLRWSGLGQKRRSRMQDKKSLPDLSGFTGTEAYHRWSILFPDVLTDGCAYLAEECGSYWLMDAISSHIHYNEKLAGEGFVVAELEVNEDSTAVLILEDGDGHELDRQEIEYTDFPCPGITVLGDRERGSIRVAIAE